MSEQATRSAMAGRARISRLALLALLLALVSAAVLGGAAAGYRAGLWDTRIALLTLTRYGAYGAGAATVVALIAVGRSWPGGTRRGLTMAAIALVIGAGLSYHIGAQWYRVKTLPFIHDITTDTDNPPEFVAVVPERVAQGANPHLYEGPELAAKQKAGYPDLGPFMAHVGLDEAFERALAVAQARGWAIVDSDKAGHRIEATDTSLFYGFKDDIVIRITPAGDGAEAGSRIDVRSLSRVGRSDVGVNAARIKCFLDELEKSFG